MACTNRNDNVHRGSRKVQEENEVEVEKMTKEKTAGETVSVCVQS